MSVKQAPLDAAPPAYSPVANAAPVVNSSAASQTDDKYGFLSQFDTVFLIDDSGSMAGSLWLETRDAIEAITPICTQRDTDGIDIYFINAPDNRFHHNVKSPATVREIFSSVRPTGTTPLARRLKSILDPYIAKVVAKTPGVKPLNVIIITDGAPSDEPEFVIIKAANKLDQIDADADQLGIQFFQVGSDKGAQQYLKSLDDELATLSGKPDLRDIVDTVTFKGDSGETLTADGILKVVLGAVNRRLDRKSREIHRTRR